MVYSWDNDKNSLLQQTRGIGFEEIVEAIDGGGLLDVYEYPNQAKYPQQKIFAVFALGYTYLVPYIQNDDGYFLKTIIPSRKAHKIYKGEDNV